jgi:hypothetical protein
LDVTPSLLFYSEEVSSRLFRNVGICPSNYTTSHTRRHPCGNATKWNPSFLSYSLIFDLSVGWFIKSDVCSDVTWAVGAGMEFRFSAGIEIFLKIQIFWETEKLLQSFKFSEKILNNETFLLLPLFRNIITELLLKRNTYQMSPIKIDAPMHSVQNTLHYAK